MPDKPRPQTFGHPCPTDRQSRLKSPKGSLKTKTVCARQQRCKANPFQALPLLP
ncbi:hypothetical protein [Kingella oralis]|uniref:hypothetical protein n=1 Tax=Kingella oralis TaxID=505 RepID=UPI0034E464E5